jgi:hypothetical protein
MNIKDVLLNFLKEHPSSFTYIGIGSAPVDIKKLTTLTDQIIPNFLSNKNTDVIRIIHFDPHFKNINKNDLNDYFISKDLGLYNYPQDGLLTWKTFDNSIEINIVPEFFDHYEDEYFLEDVIDLCLLYESHLVVQEYTGKNLYDLFTGLYKKNKNKELFKKKILFDVSYNQDCHCFIDLETYSNTIKLELIPCNLEGDKELKIRAEVWIKNSFLKIHLIHHPFSGQPHSSAA